ncbi:MAG: hypothetical protein A2039_00075 [Candidatus Melainabacteria bacterium GWA2_34_9]|nr:MAG: hypothetical protein A2039_00075 [Candidatus Melainabacteria bacterium GWA2_34_9]
MSDNTIPKANLADFRSNTIITSKKPLVKGEIDAQCKTGALFGGTVASTLEGVDLGTTQKKGIISSIFGGKPETIYNYGCKEMELDGL